MQQYINNNGKIVSAEEPVVKASNRSFRYGDALFETIRFTYNRPQFLAEHLNRLFKGMKILKMEVNASFTVEFFEKAILELAQKNSITTDGRVRLTVYRNEGGFYAPDTNSVSYIIEASPMEDVGYVLNEKGYTVDLFNDFKKQQNTLSSIKSANSLVYVLAGIAKHELQLDDCIIQNDKNHIIETISSNIFAVKNGVLYTPPVAEGCVDGVMRKKVIEIATTNKIAVYEIAVMQNVLLAADELFLTNSFSGIRWVVAYKQKRYFNNTSKKLIEKLNELTSTPLE